MNVVLYGEEKLLLAQRLEDLKKKYECNADDMNYTVYHAGETPMDQIIEDALTQPFLTEYKMIVLKNPIFLTSERPKKKLVSDEEVKMFMDYIQHDNPSTIFVVYQDSRNFDERKKAVKTLRKNAKWHEVEKLTFEQLYKATRQAIIHREASIEDKALSLLLDRCGNDLLTISNQVDKLCLYTHNIKIENVERLVPPRVEEDVFKLTRAFMDHDLKNTMKVYQDLISQNHKPLELIGLIANSLRNSYQVTIMSKKGYRDIDIAKTLGLSPRAIYPIRKNSSHFDLTQLTEKLYALSELDYGIKTGKIDAYRGLELFLMRI